MPHSKRSLGLSGLLPPATQYVGSLTHTGLSTATQNQRAFRAGLYVLPAPCKVDRVFVYMSVVGTVGGGTEDLAIRVYPADSLGRPIQGSNPLYAIDDTEMTTGGGLWASSAGDRVWTVDWNLPQMFWIGYLHNLATTGPTLNTVSTWTRGMAISDLAANPNTVAAVTVPQWTEASYAKSNTWGNAAVTWVGSNPISVQLRVAS